MQNENFQGGGKKKGRYVLCYGTQRRGDRAMQGIL